MNKRNAVALGSVIVASFLLLFLLVRSRMPDGPERDSVLENLVGDYAAILGVALGALAFKLPFPWSLAAAGVAFVGTGAYKLAERLLSQEPAAGSSGSGGSSSAAEAFCRDHGGVQLVAGAPPGPVVVVCRDGTQGAA